MIPILAVFRLKTNTDLRYEAEWSPAGPTDAFVAVCERIAREVKHHMLVHGEKRGDVEFVKIFNASVPNCEKAKRARIFDSTYKQPRSKQSLVANLHQAMAAEALRGYARGMHHICVGEAVKIAAKSPEYQAGNHDARDAMVDELMVVPNAAYKRFKARADENLRVFAKALHACADPSHVMERDKPVAKKNESKDERANRILTTYLQGDTTHV